MANFIIPLCIFLLFQGCFSQQQSQHILRAKTPCNIQRLNADEPSRRFKSEAGVTEFWDSDSRDEFECAGVEVERTHVHPRGLVLPLYFNTHKLMYVVQGNGIHGAVIPGCAETYESQPGRNSGQRSSTDRHQKLRRISEGDIIALPAGITHWFYNDGEQPLVTVTLIDVASEANQLDLNHRKFFLAGKPQRGQEQEGEQRNNIFNGFNNEILADAFNLDSETIRKLDGQDDKRGTIVHAERLDLALPEYTQEEQQQQQRERRGEWSGSPNGVEETFCSIKLRENIAHPSHADLFNPRAGRISTANSQTLPVLRNIQLSAERGTLYSNAIVAPQWNVNAHSALYAIRGSARIQVVGSNGNSVFDEEVREGQLLIVPQNFAVVQKAGDKGFEYIAFKTNDNAVTSQIAGKLSTFRALPDEVLMNAYRINREQARSLKYNRQEATLFSSQA